MNCLNKCDFYELKCFFFSDAGACINTKALWQNMVSFADAIKHLIITKLSRWLSTFVDFFEYKMLNINLKFKSHYRKTLHIMSGVNRMTRTCNLCTVLFRLLCLVRLLCLTLSNQSLVTPVTAHRNSSAVTDRHNFEVFRWWSSNSTLYNKVTLPKFAPIDWLNKPVSAHKRLTDIGTYTVFRYYSVVTWSICAGYICHSFLPFCGSFNCHCGNSLCMWHA